MSNNDWIPFVEKSPGMWDYIVLYRGTAPQGESRFCLARFRANYEEAAGTGDMLGWWCETEDTEAKGWQGVYPVSNIPGRFAIPYQTCTHWKPIFPLPAQGETP